MYRALKALLLGGLFLFVATTAALATIIVTNDPGGIIVEFQQRYATYKVAHEDIVVDGVCASACTLVLAIPDPEHVCFGPKTRMGFHSAFVELGFQQYRYSEEGTRMVWESYPENVRKLLRERGWDGGELEGWREGKLVWLNQADMIGLGYRDCAEPRWRWLLRRMIGV